MSRNSISWTWPNTDKNITFLPLSDPLCANSTCLAFNDAHVASQAQISWASQFFYANYTAYFYCALIGLAAVFYHLQRFTDYYNGLRKRAPTTVLPKGIALVRSITYRRASGAIGRIGVPSLGVGALLLASTVYAVALVFTQRPYYRGHRGYGSPPLGVRAGMAGIAMTPVVVALSGKYNIVTLLTGISYEKLNIFHRWAGYIYLFFGLVHTIPFLVAAIRDGGTARLAYQFYSMGKKTPADMGHMAAD